jgi:hypothetical protein
MRGNGGIIGPKVSVTISSVSGVFDLVEQQTFKGNATWPLSGAEFTISPAVSGSNDWDLATLGSLNLGSYGEWTITINRTFSSIVKMWGAGGARGYDYTQSPTSTSKQGDGGGGGSTFGRITFQAGTSFIVRVGQGGARGTTSSVGATYLAGGIGTTNAKGGTQGGGYSGIFLTSVTQDNAFLMAGGGGAGGDSSVGTGGAGGGTSGASGTAGSQSGGGGTSSAGGSAAGFNSATAGSALTGGVGQSTSGTNASLGGGGGGYYGGGGGNVGGGGGGSGRVGSNTAIVWGVTTAGSGSTAGNSTDSDRSDSGTGGNATQGNTGANGRIIIAKELVGSLTFDGTGDYIDVASNSAFTFGTGNFTVEFWFKGDAQADKFFYDNRGGASIGNPYITLDATGSKLRWGPANTSGSVTIADNTWHHCAVTRESGTVKLWVDGALDTSVADATNFSVDRAVKIGRNSYSTSNDLSGNLSNFRVVKGTAVYTAAFSPPTSTLSAITNTSLLVGINQLYTYDYSTKNFTLTFNGNTSYSTSVVPF